MVSLGRGTQGGTGPICSHSEGFGVNSTLGISYLLLIGASGICKPGEVTGKQAALERCRTPCFESSIAQWECHCFPLVTQAGGGENCLRRRQSPRHLLAKAERREERRI